MRLRILIESRASSRVPRVLAVRRVERMWDLSLLTRVWYNGARQLECSALRHC